MSTISKKIMLTELDVKLIEKRFWNKVNVKSKDECWNWTAGCNKDGYGLIDDGYYGKISAHRLSWRIHFGDIPKDKYVLHKCDNRGCVNPNHLYIGTQGDNMKDRSNRNPNNQGGRIACLPSRCTYLLDALVRDIRQQ